MQSKGWLSEGRLSICYLIFRGFCNNYNLNKICIVLFLVEAIPQLYQKGLTKHRKAYGIQTCLSIDTKPKVLNLFFYIYTLGLAIWIYYYLDVAPSFHLL